MSEVPLITPVMLSPEMTHTSTQTTIYIDEKGGSDDRGTKGTEADPFATLFAAYVSFPPESSTPPPTFYTRTNATKSEPGVPEWKEATKSAIKKVVGRYAEHLKKVHKAEEEEAKRQLALIEARKVVIHQDESLPVAIKMKISTKNPKGVTVNRWISTGMLAASASSNEAAFVTWKVARSLGMLVFDNQARV